MGYEVLAKTNPALVLTSITPFGQDGPYSSYQVEHLQLFNATEGHTSARKTDGRPNVGGGFLGDYDGGLAAGVATLAALYSAQRSGKGEIVDLSRFEALTALQRIDVLIARNNDRPLGFRQASRIGGLVPCKDGHVVISVAEDHQWYYLVEMMGSPEWANEPRMKNYDERPKLAGIIQPRIIAWARQHSMEDLYRMGQAARCPVGPVLTIPELLESPQLTARKYFNEVDHPVAGKHLQPGMGFLLSQAPWKCDRPAPLLGEHNDTVRPQEDRKLLGKPSAGPLPLSGIRIVDFTWAWAGSYSTFLLAQLGAEVIKVESLKRLDLSRTQSLTTGQRFTGYDRSTVFNDLNMNKRSVRLNLSEPEAADIARRLVSISDVVAQNMRPGVMDKLGVGYEDLKSVKRDIIMLSSSAVGSTGPDRTYVGYAPVFAALAGLAHVTGAEGGIPVPLYGAIDLRSATASAFGVLAALHHRYRTGEGQHVDLSSVEAVSSLAGHLVVEYQLTGVSPHRRGNDDVSMAPHNSYPCENGEWVSISVADDGEWDALCCAAGEPTWQADPRFGNQRSRWRNRRALDVQVSEWTATRSALAITELLQAVGVAAFPCLGGRGLAQDPHLEARGMVTSIDHPNIGHRDVLLAPWKFSRTKPPKAVGGPLLGEANTYVLGELLGISVDEVLELEERKVVY